MATTRKRNPAIVVREHFRDAKRAIEHAIALTDTSRIYLQKGTRTADEIEQGVYVRPRRDNEMPQNQVATLVAMRRNLTAANRSLIEADEILRQRLAELGYHPNGLPITSEGPGQ